MCRCPTNSAPVAARLRASAVESVRSSQPRTLPTAVDLKCVRAGRAATRHSIDRIVGGASTNWPPSCHDTLPHRRSRCCQRKLARRAQQVEVGEVTRKFARTGGVVLDRNRRRSIGSLVPSLEPFHQFPRFAGRCVIPLLPNEDGFATSSSQSKRPQ
jgi:hypothetical protein